MFQALVLWPEGAAENRLTHHFSSQVNAEISSQREKELQPPLFPAKHHVCAICSRFDVSFGTIQAFKINSPRTKHPCLNGDKNEAKKQHFILFLRPRLLNFGVNISLKENESCRLRFVSAVPRVTAPPVCSVWVPLKHRKGTTTLLYYLWSVHLSKQ